MKYTNVASYSTAASVGMRRVKEYPDPDDKICYVYRMTRAEWEKRVGAFTEGRDRKCDSAGNP